MCLNLDECGKIFTAAVATERPMKNFHMPSQILCPTEDLVAIGTLVQALHPSATNLLMGYMLAAPDLLATVVAVLVVGGLILRLSGNVFGAALLFQTTFFFITGPLVLCNGFHG